MLNEKAPVKSNGAISGENCLQIEPESLNSNRYLLNIDKAGHPHAPNGHHMSYEAAETVLDSADVVADGLQENNAVEDEHATQRAEGERQAELHRLYRKVNRAIDDGRLTDFSAGPAYRKATGLSNEDVMALGFRGYADLKDVAAAHKAEIDARIERRKELQAVAAKKWERSEKTRQQSEDFLSSTAEIREERQTTNERLERLLSRQRLLVGSIALERSPKMADRLRKDAIEQLEADGYVTDHLKPRVLRVVTNPSGEQSHREMAEALKEFDKSMYVGHGEGPEDELVSPDSNHEEDNNEQTNGNAPTNDDTERPNGSGVEDEPVDNAKENQEGANDDSTDEDSQESPEYQNEDDKSKEANEDNSQKSNQENQSQEEEESENKEDLKSEEPEEKRGLWGWITGRFRERRLRKRGNWQESERTLNARYEEDDKDTNETYVQPVFPFDFDGVAHNEADDNQERSEKTRELKAEDGNDIENFAKKNGLKPNKTRLGRGITIGGAWLSSKLRNVIWKTSDIRRKQQEKKAEMTYDQRAEKREKRNNVIAAVGTAALVGVGALLAYKYLDGSMPFGLASSGGQNKSGDGNWLNDALERAKDQMSSSTGATDGASAGGNLPGYDVLEGGVLRPKNNVHSSVFEALPSYNPQTGDGTIWDLAGDRLQSLGYDRGSMTNVNAVKNAILRQNGISEVQSYHLGVGRRINTLSDAQIHEIMRQFGANQELDELTSLTK